MATCVHPLNPLTQAKGKQMCQTRNVDYTFNRPKRIILRSSSHVCTMYTDVLFFSVSKHLYRHTHTHTYKKRTDILRVNLWWAQVFCEIGTGISSLVPFVLYEPIFLLLPFFIFFLESPILFSICFLWT